ncbi:MAG: DUF1273 family protein [Clostridia bacterium]|nr:DUF1273 family protein [Clostridia bacterium]
MTVTFCGHSKVYSESKEVTEKLTKIVEELINEGADEFLLGGYGHFDHISARVVKNLKEKYPHITSRLVIPYLNRQYDMKLYDDSVYPPIETTPLRFAISKRNEYMVMWSDVVVSYVYCRFGGAYNTLQFAKRKKKRIIEINLDKKEEENTK